MKTLAVALVCAVVLVMAVDAGDPKKKKDRLDDLKHLDDFNKDMEEEHDDMFDFESEWPSLMRDKVNGYKPMFGYPPGFLGDEHEHDHHHGSHKKGKKGKSKNGKNKKPSSGGGGAGGGGKEGHHGGSWHSGI